MAGRNWLSVSARAVVALCAVVVTACGGGGEVGGEDQRTEKDQAPEGVITVDLATVDLRASQRARPKVAFVTNGVASFWTIAAAGARQAAKEFDADLVLRFPGEVPKQKEVLQSLLTTEIDGIAVSMIDANSQVELVNEICDATNVVTHDSDAPGTNRLAHVGMNNYIAGRMCGELVKEALPGGGKVMLFVGRAMQDNAKRRRQGVIDELMDRPFGGFDPADATVEGEKYQVLGTRTDSFDRQKAKSNAEDSIARHPDLACMVGLFAYNPPACLEAIKGAGKEGEIKVVAFDEADETLQGILDGVVHGTVVQNPYSYGYESVKILAGAARGDRDVFPDKGFMDISGEKIREDNCQAFWDDLKGKLAQAEEGE